MLEFVGYNARVTFDKGIVRAIRQESDAATLAKCESLSPKQKIYGFEMHKAKMMQTHCHIGIIVDPQESSFIVKRTDDPRPNLILVERSGWAKAVKVVEELQRELDQGSELFFINLDPSLLPAKELDVQPSSPEWSDFSEETKSVLHRIPEEGWATIAVFAPEYPEGVGFQCIMIGSTKIHLELFDSANPPFSNAVKKAILKAGWKEPSEDIPNYSTEVAWSSEQAKNVADFMMNTLQWCLFLDASTVTMDASITEDN